VARNKATGDGGDQTLEDLRKVEEGRLLGWNRAMSRSAGLERCRGGEPHGRSPEPNFLFRQEGKAEGQLQEGVSEEGQKPVRG